MKIGYILLFLILIGCGTKTTTPVAPIQNASQKSQAMTLEKKESEDAEIDWQEFSSDLLKTSLALNKPLFVLLYIDKCLACSKMHKVLENKFITKYINNKFLATKINVNKQPGHALSISPSKNIAVPKIIMLQLREDGVIMAVDVTIGLIPHFKLANSIYRAEKLLRENSHVKSGNQSKTEPEGVSI